MQEIERISKEFRDTRLEGMKELNSGTIEKFQTHQSFIKGGSTLFPSQMPDLNKEVDKAA